MTKAPITHIRNDILKLIYATMLREMPHDLVKVFWQKNPLVIDEKKTSLAEQLRFIWDEHVHTDLNYTFSVLDAVETFCIENNIDTSVFVDKVVLGLNKGSLVHASSLLAFIAPCLKAFLNDNDLRSFCLKNIIPLVLGRMVPKGYFGVASHEVVDNCNTTAVAVCFDRTFRTIGLPYYPGLFFERPLQLAPVRLGLPAFENVRVISNLCKLETMFNRALVSYRKDGAYINKKRVGTLVPFLEYCETHNFAFDELTLPDVKVVEADDDYVCPIRKRTVLHAGSVYGAPVGLLLLKYQANVKHSDQCVAPLINETLSGITADWQFVHELHGQMMADLERKIVFIYDKKNEMLIANGERIARSAPAIIMSRILKAHAAKGKTVFAHSEFTIASQCGSVDIADNFSLRLQRLAQILLEKLPEVGIVRISRGRFQLAIKCKLEYVEQ